MADQKTANSDSKKKGEDQSFDFAKLFGMNANGQSGGIFALLSALFTAMMGGQDGNSFFSNLSKKASETFSEARTTVQETTHSAVETGKKAVELLASALPTLPEWARLQLETSDSAKLEAIGVRLLKAARLEDAFNGQANSVN